MRQQLELYSLDLAMNYVATTAASSNPRLLRPDVKAYILKIEYSARCKVGLLEFFCCSRQ